MAQIGKDGTAKVSIPGVEEMVDVANLTDGQMELLRKEQQKDTDIYAQQLTVAEKSEQSLAALEAIARIEMRKAGVSSAEIDAQSLSQILAEGMPAPDTGKILEINQKMDTKRTAIEASDPKAKTDFEQWLKDNDTNQLAMDYEQLKKDKEAENDKLINGLSNSVKSHLDKIPKLATGTDSFAGGVAIVGEKGPELVNLKKGSQVIPNDDATSGSGLRGGKIEVGGTVTLNVTGPGANRVIDMSDDDIKALYSRIQSSTVHG
jgi:hypothetical protein